MRKIFAYAVSLVLFLGFVIPQHIHASSADAPVVGIAWRPNRNAESFVNTCKAVEAAGGRWVLLDQVCSADLSYDANGHLTTGVDNLGVLKEESAKLVRCNSWHGSNAAAVVEKVNFVIFPGGEDISPTLCYKPEKWHGIPNAIDYSAERDVSDYLAMSFCLDNDIPFLAICWGMQMLSVISGAELIQDLPAYYAEQGVKYNFEHRNEPSSLGAYRDYVPHDVTVKKGSWLYRLVGSEVLHGAPSWHHQAVRSVDNTRLEVTGYTETNGIPVIEAVERTDKAFAVGIQFHPEAAIVKHIDNVTNSDDFMDYDTALSMFRRIIGGKFAEDKNAA